MASPLRQERRAVMWRILSRVTKRTSRLANEFGRSSVEAWLDLASSSRRPIAAWLHRSRSQASAQSAAASAAVAGAVDKAGCPVDWNLLLSARKCFSYKCQLSTETAVVTANMAAM